MQIGGNLHVQPALLCIFLLGTREKNCEMRIVAQRILRFYGFIRKEVQAWYTIRVVCFSVREKFNLDT